MSEKDLRRRNLVNRRPKLPLSRRPAKLPSSFTGCRSRNRSTRPPSKRVNNALQRCKSEPTLLTFDINFSVGGEEDYRVPDDAALYRPMTCADIFSPAELLVLSPQKFEGYNKDSKVVVNVTVEGSPGPVRAMVKLGSSVDETIRLVMKRYGEERRTPRLDEASSSGFELHHSYFSLENIHLLHGPATKMLTCVLLQRLGLCNKWRESSPMNNPSINRISDHLEVWIDQT